MPINYNLIGKPRVGHSGWLKLSRITLNTPAKTYDELIVAAQTDDGHALPTDIAVRMLSLKASASPIDETAPTVDLDNLLALKALEQQYAGQIKCVFIDPPYNTGSAFEHYDDGIEHSVWLELVKYDSKAMDFIKIALPLGSTD